MSISGANSGCIISNSRSVSFLFLMPSLEVPLLLVNMWHNFNFESCAVTDDDDKSMCLSCNIIIGKKR